MQAESEDRSAAAFLVTSVLESQRHPELSGDEHDSLKNSRAFVAWAVNDAIERGELTTDTDVNHLVEMLVAVMWGMGFYAGFVGNHDELDGRRAQVRAADGQQALESARIIRSHQAFGPVGGDVAHSSDSPANLLDSIANEISACCAPERMEHR